MSAGTTRKSLKNFIIVCVCLCVIALTVGGVYAYLTAKTDPLSNEFVPAKVSCLIEENFTDGVKSDVKVRNTGNIDAYIRATVVVTFVSDDGKVLATTPKEGVDYTVTWGTEGWIKRADGYWYYTKPVSPEKTTSLLIQSAQAISAPTGYSLNIRIIASGIQSEPDLAVHEAWGVTVTNGEIVS